LSISEIPRSEHPRPDFMRENWISLNGEWEFSFDEPVFDRKITVPFVCESKLSGVYDTGFHKRVWYRRTFRLPEEMQGKLAFIHFGAIDYLSRLWVNGVFIAEHEGGQTSFKADITHALNMSGENEILVQADDDPFDLGKPRGKQHWEENPSSIFYTRTTGIWQSVWLEAVSSSHLDSFCIIPRLDDKSVEFEYSLSGEGQLILEVDISFNGAPIAKATIATPQKSGGLSVKLIQPSAAAPGYCWDMSWSPEAPRLFDVEFRVVKDGVVEDTVSTYFGLRKISVENGVFMLNNHPYFQKLLLDQGYWPDSVMTAPSDESFVDDIKSVKAMGFNGVRKHQKIEDPRFLYHADRLGLLVWAESGSAYEYSTDYAVKMCKEWMEAVLRDRNHPCIVVWTPLNESWGVQEIRNDSRQQAHSVALCNLIKSIDGTRPVVDNDGWEHTCGDLLTIHDYSSNPDILRNRYREIPDSVPGGKPLFADGWKRSFKSVIVSEFGGIKHSPESEPDSWGYCEDKSPEEYLEHFRELSKALRESPVVQGYCYTQFTDVGTERNGLLHSDRSPKIPLDLIKKANVI
jgi:beta-galactosidase/beta-glucuronidase